MAVELGGLRLAVLSAMADALPDARTTEEAAEVITRALAPVDVAASVNAIESDTAVVMALNVPPGVGSVLSPDLAARLVGQRLPLGGLDAIDRVVRLRTTYCGRAGSMLTLRALAPDPAMTRAFTDSVGEQEIIAVPVISADAVVAVIAAWGKGCSRDLVPMLETAAAMLADAWAAARSGAGVRAPRQSQARSKAELRSAVLSLIDESSIVAALQPILRLYDSTAIGYEALARFTPAHQLSTPDELFAAASTLHMQADVDWTCLAAALREVPNVGAADLFVNVLIGTLLLPRRIEAFHELVRRAGVDPASIVLEFSEREPVSDLSRLQRIASDLRARGFRIAVDDAGAGHASMRVIAELRPEFIKVDRSLIHSVDSNRARRALVIALLSFSGHIGARLVAEGIETESERETLLSLGVQFGQGWLLGRPVLTQPLSGHEDIEVVDPGRLARRRLSPTSVEDVYPRLQPAERPTESTSAEPPGARRGLARALSDAARALQSEHDPMRILGVMAEQLACVVPVNEMAIFVADYATHRLVPVLATGPDREQVLADSFSLDAGLTGWAFGLGTPQLINDTNAHTLARQVPGTPVVSESLLLIPLVATEHKLGIINCWRSGVGQFSRRDLEAASLFAHVAASAWRNAQLYTDLHSAAMTDPLTGLYNSRWLRDTGDRDLTRASRDKHPLSLLLVDLDHFKTVNDTGGHAVGDLLLQRVAARLRSAVRGADAVARLGGEEFVVLLHNCDVDSAGAVAEAMLLTLRETALPDGCGLTQLTASIGIASYPEHGVDFDQLLAAADRAMYKAKHAGRDRIAVATASGVTQPQAPRRRANRRAS